MTCVTLVTLGTAIDIILIFVLIEGIALVVLHRRTGRGIAPRRLLGNLAAGFFLMLSTRLALGQAGDGPIAACLLAALIAHILDLAARWRTPLAPGPQMLGTSVPGNAPFSVVEDKPRGPGSSAG